MVQSFRYTRLAGLIVLAAAVFAWLQYRLVRLQIVEAEKHLAQAEHFTDTRRVLEPWRGVIKDRNGQILAQPEPLFDVYLNATVSSNHLSRVIPMVAPLLGTSETNLANGVYYRLAQQRADTNASPARAILLTRKVAPEEWARMTNTLAGADFGFNLSGRMSSREKTLLDRLRRKAIFARPTQGRVYPYSNSLAHVLGFVSPTNDGTALRGMFGLEASCNALLAGQPGLCVSEQDSAGNELAFRRQHYSSARDGSQIVLTIDMRLQRIAEQALAEVMRTQTPSNASVLITRPRTGEILAWASLPAFDPRSPAPTEPGAWINHPLSDQVEPGSTLKVFTLAAVLNEGLIQLDDPIDCERGSAMVGNVRVKDHASVGQVTVREALAKSSNIGFAKLAWLLGSPRLQRYLRDFGFGQATGVSLAGEKPGWLPAGHNWSAMTLTRAAFGHGLAVSQLQMAAAMGAVGNNGMWVRPSLISRIESPEGKVLYQAEPKPLRQVIRPEVARQVRLAMQAVVEPGGTATKARLTRYTVCGKTGTAQKSDRTGYLPGRYYASFIGLLPVENPEICIAVAVDEPQQEYYGGMVAAPVFRKIAEQVAVCLGIPPDKDPFGATNVADTGGL